MRPYSWLGVALVLLAVTIGSVAWFIKKCPVSLAPTAGTPVKMERVSRGRIPYVLQAWGELRPLKEANIVARMPGTVKEVRYKLGDSVSKGALLAVIDPKQFIQPVERVEASLTAAQSDLEEKERQLADAEEELDKTQQMFKRDLIAKREVEQAQIAAQMARAELELAKAQVAQQRALLVQSRKVIGLTRLTAPFSGVVTGRLVEPGQEVRDSTPILTVGSLETLKVVIRVSNDDLKLLREGTVVEVYLDKPGGEVRYGKIARFNSGFEGKTVVEVHLPNQNHELRPGAKVSVSFTADPGEDLLLVPVSAVMEAHGQAYVYKLVNGRTERANVLKGAQKDGKVAIKSGLAEGEWVVSSGQEHLGSGTTVQVDGAPQSEQTAVSWKAVVCFLNDAVRLKPRPTTETD